MAVLLGCRHAQDPSATTDVTRLDADLIVFVDPQAADDQIAAVAAALSAHEFVDEFELVSQREALEQFLSITTDPEIREAVSVELFPPSFEVVATDPRHADALADSLRPLPGVFSIETAQQPTPADTG